MEYLIRHMTPEEFPMLEDFLYEAIFVPKGFDETEWLMIFRFE